jgi:hypothetical protein
MFNRRFDGDTHCISCGAKLFQIIRDDEGKFIGVDRNHKCSTAHEAARLQIQRTYYRNPIPPSYNERLQYGFSLTSMDD